MRELLRATEAACEAIWLSVYSENARAIAFYTRSGFRLAGEHDFLVGEDRQKDFLMRRDVAKEGTR
jgi:ribosomal protein S18 acetylase RimI-like enzyme